MFEFDLGNTFNYAEMAGLIARGPSWSNAATTTAWRPTNGWPTSMPRCGCSTPT